MRLLPIVFSALTLASCTFFTGGDGGEQTSSSSSSVSSAADITRNVSYEGTLEEPGIGIYQQGTHQLALTNGDIVLLETADSALDLDMYVGQRVEVRGAVRPTVEAGGTIMNVEEVTVMAGSSSTSSFAFCGGIAAFPCNGGFTCVDDPNDACDPLQGDADCGGICIPLQAQPSSAALSSAVSSSSSKAQTVSSAATSIAISSSASSMQPLDTEEVDAAIVLMSKQDYFDSAQWTQQYCTGHIGFCIPVHRNWYYKSFGSTTSSLWHVEFSMKDIEELHQGTIVLELAPGSSASAGGTSGQVSTRGSTVVGYLDWEEGRHFEITADERLLPAVSYLLFHVEKYSLAEGQ